VSDVPYITYAKEKYLPVFYFEGDTGPLQDAVIPVGDLEMAYLRLLYHVQGIREELINSPSAAKVVPLTSVLQASPPQPQWRSTGQRGTSCPAQQCLEALEVGPN